MTDLEKGVADAQNQLTAAIAAARAGGYRVSWQVNGDGEHTVVMNGGPEPVPAPVAEDVPTPAVPEAQHQA